MPPRLRRMTGAAQTESRLKIEEPSKVAPAAPAVATKRRRVMRFFIRVPSVLLKKCCRRGYTRIDGSAMMNSSHRRVFVTTSNRQSAPGQHGENTKTFETQRNGGSGGKWSRDQRIGPEAEKRSVSGQKANRGQQRRPRAHLFQRAPRSKGCRVTSLSSSRI